LFAESPFGRSRPAGSKLAFDTVSGTNFNHYILDLETSVVNRLTEGSAGDSRPEWSPDMTQLIFDSTRDRGGSVGGAGRWEEFELYVLDLTSRDAERLTTNDSFDAHPDWCVPKGQETNRAHPGRATDFGR
jgi:Tol biopolymer transport system component